MKTIDFKREQSLPETCCCAACVVVLLFPKTAAVISLSVGFSVAILLVVTMNGFVVTTACLVVHSCVVGFSVVAGA